MGTWACNGSHKWRCYSSGTDTYKNLHPRVPAKYTPPEGRSLGGVPGSANNQRMGKHGNIESYVCLAGSSQLFSVRGVRMQKSAALPVTLESKFIRCRCTACRAGLEQQCPSSHEFGTWQQNIIRLKNQRKRGENGTGSGTDSIRGGGRGGGRGRGREAEGQRQRIHELQDPSLITVLQQPGGPTGAGGFSLLKYQILVGPRR